MDYANEIKSRVSSKEAFLFYGIELDRSGFCKCFLTGERTASLKVYDGNRGWHCFGCHAHGSVIDFVMQYFGLAFTDAISKINTDFSLGLPIGERIPLRQRREMERRQRERQEERNREQRERERLEGEYWVAFDVWRKYDTNKREYAPKSPGEDFHLLFVEAVKNIDYATHLLETAEMRLKDYADKRHNNSQH
jgi:hypothetical protein